MYNHTFSGWWFQPIWKYARQIGFTFPNFRGENKTYLIPPPKVNNHNHGSHGVSKIGVPQNGWFMMGNPIKMDTS